MRMAVKKDVAVRLGVIYVSSGDQQERGMLHCMPRLQSEAPRLHLERARNCEGGSETAWGATIGQGVPGQGVMAEGVKGGK
jgi:hypothetical protein